MEFHQTMLLPVICCVILPLVRSMAVYPVLKSPVSYADGDTARSYFMGYGCERSNIFLDCENKAFEQDSNNQKEQYISVVWAVYGRNSPQICHEGNIFDNNWSYSCAASRKRTTRVVSLRCNGRTKCIVPADNGIFGDPCPGTFKYLEIYYACVSAPHPQLIQLN